MKMTFDTHRVETVDWTTGGSRLEHRLGCMLEEMVLVEGDGCTFLSRPQTELPVLHFPS